MAGVVVALSSRVGGMAERLGFKPPLFSGVVLIAAGLVIDASQLGSGRDLATWTPVVALIGLGIGLCYPLLSAAAVRAMPASELAAATAVNQCARQLGAALGVAVTVAALGPRTPAPLSHFHLAWLLGAALAALGGVAAAALPHGREPAFSACEPARIAA
jgi:MFS family permease